jgi:hypothetical protein
MDAAKGSTWNKWDLHVHTPASFHQDFSLNRSLGADENHKDAV